MTYTVSSGTLNPTQLNSTQRMSTIISPWYDHSESYKWLLIHSVILVTDFFQLQLWLQLIKIF